VERHLRGYLAWEADQRLPPSQQKGVHRPFVKLETLQELRAMLLRVIGDDACRLLGNAFLHTSDITIVRDTMPGEDQERHTVYIFPPGHKPGGK
jgi:hypothetical protein